jgi:hypothetical protein
MAAADERPRIASTPDTLIIGESYRFRLWHDDQNRPWLSIEQKGENVPNVALDPTGAATLDIWLSERVNEMVPR